MIPAALFAILAISRLGAIHTVVFGGFAPASLAQRIEASKPRAVMTASCGIEGAKGPMDYKPFIEGALQKSTHEPERVIVWQRDELRWDPIRKNRGERNWQRLVKSARNRGLKAEAVPVKSSDGIYIIYTSGERRPIMSLRDNPTQAKPFTSQRVTFFPVKPFISSFELMTLPYRYHGSTQRCTTRGWRARGRPEPVNKVYIRCTPRRRHILCLGHWMGSWPFLHPVCPTSGRGHHCTL